MKMERPRCRGIKLLQGGEMERKVQGYAAFRCACKIQRAIDAMRCVMMKHFIQEGVQKKSVDHF
jgi:hypothetical protein